MLIYTEIRKHQKEVFISMSVKTTIRDILFILIGTAMAGAGYAFFIIPHKIVPGGVGAISVVIHYFFNVSFGISYTILNIPIFIWGTREIGKKFGIRSIAGILLISIFTELFTYFLKNLILTNSLLLASLYGGLFLGAGLGFVFKGRGSTGGTDIVGRIMSKHTGIPIGQSILVIDTAIIVISSFTFHSMDIMLVSFITLFVSSKMIDIVLEGRAYARAAIIFTNKGEEIGKIINKELSRGVTIMEGRGSYTGEPRDVLFSVIHRREEEHLREIVKDIDPEAFVVITEVSEVLGKGFKPRKL